MRGEGAVGGEILRDVAVGVERGEIGLAVLDFGQQAAYTAGALEGTGEVEAPEEGVCECVRDRTML